MKCVIGKSDSGNTQAKIRNARKSATTTAVERLSLDRNLVKRIAGVPGTDEVAVKEKALTSDNCPFTIILSKMVSISLP